MSNTKAFLKYFGGKYKQAEKIKQLLPTGDRLIEPFVGAGSIFLNTDYHSYLLADINPDLINTFKILAAYQEEFIDRCKEYFTPCTNNLETYNYYRQVFNALDMQTISHDGRISKACLFVFLNRHGLRGLCRYNVQGEFNVPYGYYESIYFPEAEMKSFINKINSAEIVEFRVADFRETSTMARPGDVVYCDPPYTPLSATANFTRYVGEKFSWYDQIELFALCKKIKLELGVGSVISNHETIDASLLYENGITNMVKTFVNRSISYKTRVTAPELLACV